jgi:SAM-dependent methyltransferase
VADALSAHAPASVEDVLEVGCGSGGFLARLRDLLPGARLRGIEPNDAARTQAEKRGAVVEPGTFEHLPVDDHAVDIVFALDVLEHCGDDAAALAEARRVLRPGGLLIVTVPALPALWSRWDDVNAHRRRYLREGLADLARGAGFEVTRTTYFNMLLLPIGWAVRKLSRPSGGQPPPGADLPPRPVNALLALVFGLERRFLRHAGLPIGMSLLLVARRL